MRATNLPLGRTDRFSALHQSRDRGRSQPQDVIYRYLQDIVRDWVPEEVLLEFKNLFIHANGKKDEALEALRDIVRGNQEQHFIGILERASYIILNHWELHGQARFVPQLIQSFGDPTIEVSSVSPILRRVRMWLKRFVGSPAYQELQLFATRHLHAEAQSQVLWSNRWSDRYLAYKLAAQAIDVHKSGEQRELAATVAQKHKDHFKFALAKYVTRCQFGDNDRICPNPTIFGDRVLRLIKSIVVKKQGMSSAKVAKLFVERSRGASYDSFKTGLQQYLFGACQKQGWATQLTWQFTRKLDRLYPEKKNVAVDDALRFRTCNRAIEWLTTENRREPSELFQLLASRGNPLTLAFVLLKLVLIVPQCRNHLERCIADLIQYYEGLPEEECQGAIQFFEMFKILFAIYAEDVEYTLVKVKHGSPKDSGSFNPQAYRLFARMKSEATTSAKEKKQLNPSS
ncbi:MAG: hypothetical protein SWY16_25260 [Cyanobacteriota bacterium]|nr:hypothetical protein [Cyanobacteriota bacterium]